MRVYTPEEAMDLLSCNAPHWDASTLVWQGFLHRAAPLTRATQRGIAEAARELAHRCAWGRLRRRNPGASQAPC